jgi:hypothetical protein
MEIKNKFEMGQKVYYVGGVSIKYEKIHVPCNICDSTGEVEIKGQTFKCPHCGGKYTEDYEHKKMYFSKPSTVPRTIGQIRVKITENKQEIQYMCKETGINSGTVYDENRLFATYGKALEFVEKANEEMANGKHWSEV